jgi:hypothetical protein
VSPFKKIKQLYQYHETTRLLLDVADQRVTRLSNRVLYLEDVVEYLLAEAKKVKDA